MSEDVHVMKAPSLFSTRTTFLYVQFKYTENKKHFICVEFLVFMLSSRHYRPEMLASDILGLSIVVPRPFYLENRHTDVTVHGSENKSKAVSYRKSIKPLYEGEGWERVAESETQTVKLLEAVEDEIHFWTLDLIDNNCPEVCGAIEQPCSNLFVLTCNMICKKQDVIRQKAGGIRKSMRGSGFARPAAPSNFSSPPPPATNPKRQNTGSPPASNASATLPNGHYQTRAAGIQANDFAQNIIDGNGNLILNNGFN